MKNKFPKIKLTKVLLFLMFIGTLIGGYYYLNHKSDLPKAITTSNNPELVYLETQKALQLLSTNINIGMKSVSHIKEYDNSKKLIFK